MCSMCQEPFDSEYAEGKETLPCFHEICKKCRKDANESKRKFCEICHYHYDDNIISNLNLKPADSDYFQLLQTFLTQKYPLLLDKIKIHSQIPFPNYEKHLENINKTEFPKNVSSLKFRLIEIYKILFKNSNDRKVLLENMQRVEKLVCSIITNPDENRKKILSMIIEYTQWLLVNNTTENINISYSAQINTPANKTYVPQDGSVIEVVSIKIIDGTRTISISNQCIIDGEFHIIRNFYFGTTENDVYMLDKKNIHSLYPEHKICKNSFYNTEKISIQNERLIKS